jgi:hypothetical protein
MDRRIASITRIAFLVLLVAHGTAGAAPDKVYFTEYKFNDPKIRSINLDGTGMQELFTPPPAEWLPVGCDYDAVAGKIYWSQGNTPGTIRRANLDGSAMQLLLTGLKIPRGMSVDAVHGKMYWVESPPAGNATGLLRRANLDGTSVETVYADTPYDPVLSYVGKPTVDPANGYVYFCARGEIRRARLDGTGTVQTVVRGVTTVAAIALDAANDRIYFADANTNSDYIGRARLDDTDFSVLYDNTPGFAGTSGLFDLKADLEGGRLYWTDELAKTVRRAHIDGSGMETIYTAAADLAPTALTLNTDPLQPIQDCNGNSIRDLDDLDDGTSQDCNANGIPDECESDPCVPVTYAVDNGSDPSGHRTVSGDPSTGFEVFQPFDLAEPLTVTEIGLDGWTILYHPAGFTATIFPDDGTGVFPDEDQPFGSAAFQWRFSPNTIVWVYRPVQATLQAGRWWVRLTANSTTYAGAACYGTGGPTSLSRRLSNGQIVYASRSIALRIRGLDPAAVEEVAADGYGTRVYPPEPNPARGAVRIRFDAGAESGMECDILDPGGRIVRSLETPVRDGRTSVFVWDGRFGDGRNAPSGVYFALVKFRDPKGAPSSLRSGPLIFHR